MLQITQLALKQKQKKKEEKLSSLFKHTCTKQMWQIDKKKKKVSRSMLNQDRGEGDNFIQMLNPVLHIYLRFLIFDRLQYRKYTFFFF